MKKKLLFNYFLQKCVQKEQELLSTDDFKTALLAVIVSRANLIRHYAQGVTMEAIYFCKPFYAQELFIYLCFNAYENGDCLHSSFNFKKVTSNRSGSWGDEAYEDADITKYLYKVFDYPKGMKDIDCTSYSKIVGENAPNKLLDMFYNLSNFRNVTVTGVELPAACPETEMIDRAWNRLMNDENFINMLKIGAKHDSHGRSYAYRSYCEKVF